MIFCKMFIASLTDCFASKFRPQSVFVKDYRSWLARWEECDLTHDLRGRPTSNSQSPGNPFASFFFFRAVILLAFLTSFAFTFRARGAAADPSASAKTQSVWEYLKNLPNGSSKRVVSGQLIFFQSSRLSSQELTRNWFDIIQQTGHAPGMMHMDYLCSSGCSSEISKYASQLQTLINHWNAGGLVQLSVHHSNPVTGGLCSDTRFSEAAFARLLTPGDPVNKAYFAEVDLIAQQLQTLQNAGVVVLYRPLFEMNGGWFWWSSGTTPQFVQLWQMEFSYLTKTRGLHNLLFVWAPFAGSGNYSSYYPGDGYVDITGLDEYEVINGTPVPKLGGYDELTAQIAPSKPFGLPEYGPLSVDGGTTPQDYYQLIRGIKQSMPKTTFWASWNDSFTMGLAFLPRGRHLNVGRLLSDPWVVNEGDVNFSQGFLLDKTFFDLVLLLE